MNNGACRRMCLQGIVKDMIHGVQRHIWRFLIFAVFFSLYQASLVIVDPDVFYHARMVLLQSQGLVRELPALPLTVFEAGFVDHHYLYHLAVIPLLWVVNIIAPSGIAEVLYPIIAIKISAALFAAMFATLFWALLEQWRVPSPKLWMLTMLGSSSFLFRLNIPKAPALSLAWLVIGLMIAGWASQGGLVGWKRWLLLAIHALVYVWLYNGWIVWLVIVGIVTIASIIGAYARVTLPLLAPARVRDLGAVILGVVAGHLFSPYFPDNIWFAWQHIVRIGFGGIPNGVEVGREWYGLGINPFLYIESMSAILITTMVIVAGLVRVERVRWSAGSVYLGIVSLIFLFLTSQSRRHIEYFIPIAVLFLAVFVRDQQVADWRRLFSRVQWKLVGVLLSMSIVSSIISTAIDMNTPSHSARMIIPSAQWLRANIPEQSMIVLRNWAYFPGYWYFAPNYQYVGGLDPRFTQFAYPDVFARWQKLINGSSTDPVGDMKFLNSRVVVLHNKADANLIEKFTREKEMERSYADDVVTIFTLR